MNALTASTAPTDGSVAAMLSLLSLAIGVALYVWTALALAAMFRKMGEEAWKGWVPLLNTATLLRWGGFSPWLVLLVLVPPLGVVVFVLVVICAHRVGAGFGYGGGMTVLAALVFVAWASILGFGPARWLGARPPGWTPAVPAAPAAPVAPVAPTSHGTDAVALRHDGHPDGGASAFAPPPSTRESPWAAPDTKTPRHATGPDTRPTARPPRPAAPDAGGRAAGDGSHAVPPADADDEDAGDTGWPTELDDVSAIGPSPYPPTAADGSSVVVPVVPVVPVASDAAPIDSVPGRRSPTAPSDVPVAPLPVARTRDRTTRVSSGGAAASPVTPAGADDSAPVVHAPRGDDLRAPLRRRARPSSPVTAAPGEPEGFPELSGEVSAVIGSPAAGTPRSALTAVPAQQRRLEPFADEDDLDRTVISRRPGRAAWQLVPASGAPVPITSDVVIMGRRPSDDAAFPTAQLIAVSGDARTVSKTHARLERRDEGWVVTDLGSTNGVVVRTLTGDDLEAEPGSALDAGERFFLGDEEFHLQRVEH